MFLRLVGCVIFVFTIVFFVFPAENKLRRGFIGECTLVLIFYNCLFGLLILFFRIRRIQMVHQFIQIYLKIGVFFVQTVLSTVIRIVRVQIVLFSHSSGMPSPSVSSGAGSDLYSGQPPTSIGWSTIPLVLP